MSVVLRADEAPDGARLDHWCEGIREVVGPHEVRAPDGVDRRDRLAIDELGAVLVGDMSAHRETWVRRTRRNIARSTTGDDLCKVHVMISGHGAVRQDGREAHLGPGDLALVDLARPAGWDMAPMRCVIIAFPRPLLPMAPGDAAALTAVRIPGDAGPGRLASSLARHLPVHLADDAPATTAATGTRLGAAVLDVLAVAMAAHIDRVDRVPAHSRHQALLARIHAFIEARLGDPDLSPAAIAAAHHLSVRTLYNLFEAQQATVAGWVRRRRLERCRRDLADPAQATVPVSTIARRWGLTNPGHFSRAFRTAYGVPPAEYRRLALGAAAGPAGTGKDRAGDHETPPGVDPTLG